MEIVLFVVVSLFWSSVQTEEGVEGGQVTITCSRDFAINNPKFFCRDPCQNKDILVQTDGTEKRARNDRFYLYDHRDGSFTVTISELKPSDSGIYRCGVDRFFVDTYQRVVLTVKPAQPKPSTLSPTSAVTATTIKLSTTSINLPTTINLFTTSMVVVVALGVTSVFLITAYRWKRRRVKEPVSPGTQGSSRLNTHPGNTGEDYENDRAANAVVFDRNNHAVDLQPRTTNQDSLYQTLHPQTTNQDSLYQTLHPQTTNQDSLYQSLHPQTTNQDSLYQTLHPQTTNQDSLYQTLHPQTTNQDSLYQSLHPQTTN